MTVVQGTCLRRMLNVYRGCRSWFDPKKTVCGDFIIDCCFSFASTITALSRKPEKPVPNWPGCFVCRFNSTRVKDTTSHCLSKTAGTFQLFKTNAGCSLNVCCNLDCIFFLIGDSNCVVRGWQLRSCAQLSRESWLRRNLGKNLPSKLIVSGLLLCYNVVCKNLSGKIFSYFVVL